MSATPARRPHRARRRQLSASSPDPEPRDLYQRKFKTRFFGVKTLNSDKIALDFKNVADEIIANLREEGIELVVKIEIEATKPNRFEEGQMRTLSENAQTLKFDQSGFEES